MVTPANIGGPLRLSFEHLSSVVFRGASGVLHPTSMGLDPVAPGDGERFMLARSGSTTVRVPELGLVLMVIGLVIAEEAATWLIPRGTLAHGLQHVVEG